MLKYTIFLMFLIASSFSNGCKDKATAVESSAPMAKNTAAQQPAPQRQKPPQLKPRKKINPRLIFNEYVEPYPLNNLALDSENKIYQQAMVAYKNEDWQEAFDLFYKLSPKTDQTLMYEASCKMQQTYFLQAKQVLLTLNSLARGKTKQHAEWNLALVDLVLGENPIAQFQQIKSDPEHLFAVQAGEILTKITQ